jgi:phage baseplate assembly protein W
MSTEHGYDLSGILDLSPDLRTVHGREALIEALARRLTTPRGGLWYDPSYGHDVRQYVNAPSPQPGLVESQVSAECLKDERVLDAEVTVLSVGEELRISVEITDARGPFTLTLVVTQVTVELLRNAA